jgi:hypothetical protein
MVAAAENGSRRKVLKVADTTAVGWLYWSSALGARLRQLQLEGEANVRSLFPFVATLRDDKSEQQVFSMATLQSASFW